MERTILSQQELIAKLSFLLIVKQQQHTIAESNAVSALQTQMQTITFQKKLYFTIASQFEGSYTISSCKAGKQ